MQRSKWYHNYGYGNLRDYGLADKRAAIEQLARAISPEPTHDQTARRIASGNVSNIWPTKIHA
jgi:hypothetical protein